MPVISTNAKVRLHALGKVRVGAFCVANGLPIPDINIIAAERWHVDACAYYRPDTPRIRELSGLEPGINICIARCQWPAGEASTRNWSWPGSTVDRTPYGVLAHELGHHVDWLTGTKKWEYGSEYCEQVLNQTKEPALTGYNDNPAEWFAEMFRLFVTNPALLALVRPRTHAALRERFRPVGGTDWVLELGPGCPRRVVEACRKKCQSK